MTPEIGPEAREAVTQLRAAVSFVPVAAQLARVSDYLLQAEIDEGDPWYQEDIRVAGVMVGYAEEGRQPSYERAFLELHGKYPSEVVGWWRDRRKLLVLAQDANRPTPLLLADRASELLLNRDWVEVPDHGPAPAGILPRLPSVPYVGEFRPGEEPPQPQSEPTARPKSVCIHCAKPTCAGSKIHCFYHYRQNRKASQRCYKRKAAHAICLKCKLPAIEGSQYCEAHRERHNAFQRESAQRMRELRREHPELIRPSRKAVNAAYRAGYRAGRKEQSVCLQCGQPTAGSYCIDCRQKHAQAQQRSVQMKRAQGICLKCSKPVCAPGQSYCRSHRAKYNARSRAYMQRRRALKTMQRAQKAKAA